MFPFASRGGFLVVPPLQPAASQRKCVAVVSRILKGVICQLVRRLSLVSLLFHHSCLCSGVWWASLCDVGSVITLRFPHWWLSIHLDGETGSHTLHYIRTMPIFYCNDGKWLSAFKFCGVLALPPGWFSGEELLSMCVACIVCVVWVVWVCDSVWVCVCV